MPNFALSAELRQNFAPSTKSAMRQEGRVILESLNRYGVQNVRAFSELQAVSPTVRQLVTNPNVELAMLFIDITSFSTKTATMSAAQIATILDAYYAQVLPIIYEFDGEVEKIIGDGIIAVFGKPFTPGHSAYQWLQAAEQCAGKIGRARHSSPYSVKIALHYGKLLYYHNSKTTVDEFYAIGQPMTELFRLEGEGVDKEISYYVNGGYDLHRRAGLSVLDRWWLARAPRPVQLKGVAFTQVIDLY
ncbi:MULTISPECIES: adenylate/guanylate cyclase domain-containing protein [Hymenobacter]|jgi:class 3 adenylate cyclase|uniref:Adenylate/guanylate cyclase domain-containing protein n=2 Tax=Hymenobacter TaxID=89966 RepID=A0A4Z0MD06_9BACT|nr:MULTISPECIES: adenylate/guanylate cyclase domain-containing protein [Hymenobacter]TGD77376.1 adenylate/guanylate cyclase domain-containing protein [Hymenobacter wooponensis]TGE03476.1 adenylate/guanylate cyclase domain-containing protein [Hymenobacter fodinae]